MMFINYVLEKIKESTIKMSSIHRFLRHCTWVYGGGCGAWLLSLPIFRPPFSFPPCMSVHYVHVCAVIMPRSNFSHITRRRIKYKSLIAIRYPHFIYIL